MAPPDDDAPDDDAPDDDAPHDDAPDDRPAVDVGPDPVWGLGIFAVGLLVMALGGANTWHWVFNAGETLLLIGAIVFLACTAATSLKQHPVDWRKALRSVLKGKDDA